MTKRAKKRSPTQTPPEWADLLREHDHELTRVRMLWRRGGGRYRPIVPVNLALEDLEALEFEDWEELELDESHFEWATPTDESEDQRERRLADTARELWAVAMMWTRAKGPVCDFQLRGYGSGDEIAFEDGKRCNLSGEQSRYDDNGQERASIDDTMRAMIGDERGAWHQMDRVKDNLISRLSDDRDRLFSNLEKTIAAAPMMIDDARGILERAIDFQQRHFEDYVSRAGGQRELEAKAFAEYQQTKRNQAMWAFLREGLHAIGAAIPTAAAIFEDITGKDTTIPKFECAQQAIAYLALSLEPERIAVCFKGTDEERIERCRTLIKYLDQFSKIPDEGKALAQVEQTFSFFLATDKFRQVATPEEKIAARFIIGRAALRRMQHDHSDE